MNIKGRALGIPVLLMGVITALLLGADPVAAKTFKGKTSQGRAASVVLDDATGAVQLVRIRWRAGCANGGRVLLTTDFEPGPEGPRRRVRASGTYFERDERRVRMTITTSLNAVRPTPTRWRGNFRVSVIVRQRGSFLTRCRLGPIRWSATARR